MYLTVGNKKLKLERFVSNETTNQLFSIVQEEIDNDLEISNQNTVYQKEDGLLLREGYPTDNLSQLRSRNLKFNAYEILNRPVSLHYTRNHNPLSVTDDGYRMKQLLRSQDNFVQNIGETRFGSGVLSYFPQSLRPIIKKLLYKRCLELIRTSPSASDSTEIQPLLFVDSGLVFFSQGERIVCLNKKDLKNMTADMSRGRTMSIETKPYSTGDTGTPFLNNVYGNRKICWGEYEDVRNKAIKREKQGNINTSTQATMLKTIGNFFLGSVFNSDLTSTISMKKSVIQDIISYDYSKYLNALETKEIEQSIESGELIGRLSQNREFNTQACLRLATIFEIPYSHFY